MDIKEEIDFSDIQGICRFAHGRLTNALFILLKIKNTNLAKQWLSQAPVSSAESTSPLPQTALQIAFTAKGLDELGLNRRILSGFSEPFLSGMASENRARRLGDVGTNAPSTWYWGSNDENHPDVLLMLYARPGKLDDLQKEIMGTDFDHAFEVQLGLPTNDQIRTEPFGFADGISQPAIDWDQQQSTDLHSRYTFSNLLALGEVLLGYRNEYGEFTDRPLLNPKNDTLAEILLPATENPRLRDLGRNGSYLVFRQLEQDVEGFWEYIRRASGGDERKMEDLAAAMVGRHRDGTPLVPGAKCPIPGIDQGDDLNQFDFDSDPEGSVCPIGAHIRRSNPRTGDYPPGNTNFLKRLISLFGFNKDTRRQDLVASTRYHRILRRGRQYGSDSTGDRNHKGLHFICLSANITRQFEFVQNAWIANAKFAGLQNESDPLLGNRLPLSNGSPTNQFSRPQKSGPARLNTGLPQFITVQGGAYFFLPGIRALKYIAQSQPSEDGG